MLKRIKQIKNKRLIVADALLVAALVIAFAVTYDISKHAGLYLLSGEILVAASLPSLSPILPLPHCLRPKYW